MCDLPLLESVQRRWTRHIEGVSELSYREQLAALDLHSVKGYFLRDGVTKCWAVRNRKSYIHREDLFVLAPVVGTQGHRHKLAYSRASLECRKRFFTVGCTDVWNPLPDNAVASESVGSFKAALHSTLGPLFEFIE